MPNPDYTLRLRAQTLIAEGKLPTITPVRTVSGFGTGRSCSLCDDLVLSTEPEVKLYFHPRPFEPYIFHWACYVAWSDESVRARSA